MVGKPKAIPGRRSGADDEDEDVQLKVMAKKISWWEAAEIIGVTDRRKNKPIEKRRSQPDYVGR